jgi:hypothetical protein
MQLQTHLQTAPAKAVAALGILAVSALLYPTAVSAQQQAPACGLDAMLVIDSSGSIGNDMTSVQSAFKSFVDSALVGDTQMGVVDFDDNAQVVQAWTNDQSAAKNGIDTLSDGGSTNWEAAITTAADEFPHRTSNNPDVIIFASDGNPTEPGSDSDALSAAQSAANQAKNNGIYIKSIGIGSDIDGSNLSSISSDGSFIDSDFDQLEADLLSLANTLCEEVEEESGSTGNDTIRNTNRGDVDNYVGSSANSGYNEAGGSTGGTGGRGGDIRAIGGDVDNTNTGNGGNGGSSVDGAESGAGGFVSSGSASAVSVVTNRVNRNDSTIDRCACNGDGDGHARVRNDNNADVDNHVGGGGLEPTGDGFGVGYTDGANSGYNTANGSTGGTGGRGGDVSAVRTDQEDDTDVTDSRTGSGGDAGASGIGGTVRSGNASASSDVLNRVNVNRSVIRR